MDCGTTFAKYVLFIFNAIVSILGILVIVFGVLILNSIGMIEVNGQTGFPPQAAMPIGMITIGSIVVFISFLGCCGAIREDVCMTMFYAVLMLILLIVQLVVVVLLWTNQDKIEGAMDNVIESAWESEIREAGVFEVVQKSLKCCGVNGAQDYALAGFIPPKSCCPADETCILINYYSGCKKEARKFIAGSSEKAKYFGIGLIVVELVGFIFACCLANNVRNNKRRNAY